MKIRLSELVKRKYPGLAVQEITGLVLSGNVFVNGEKCSKIHYRVNEDSDLIVRLKDDTLNRASGKIIKALDWFGIDPEGMVVIDIGASQGGFTSELVKRNAKKVFAIDVAYGILAWELRKDPKVVPMERTNIRDVTFDDIGEYADLIVVDVSFKKIRSFAHKFDELLSQSGSLVCLLKPQFEAVGEFEHSGVLLDKPAHSAVFREVLQSMEQNGFFLADCTHSPVKGRKGNIEYLLHFTRSDHSFDVKKIGVVIDTAFKELIDGKGQAD